MSRRKSGVRQVLCLARGEHAGGWTIRPPVIGAGVSIQFIYWQRTCTRCGANEAVWHAIEPVAGPFDERLGIHEWLERAGVAVPPEPTPDSPRGMPKAVVS